MSRAAVAMMAMCVLLVAAGSTASAQRPGASPPPEGQRFVSRDHGIALTVPAGWHLATASRGLPIFERVLVAREDGGTGRCVVETFRFSGARIEEIASTLGSIRGYRKASVAPAVTMPAGDMVRLYAPALPERGQDISDTYVFETDEGYAWLTCTTTGAYAGETWYDMAESIELLSTGRAPATAMPVETTGLPTCAQLETTFRHDHTTGSVLEDAVYMTRCVTCDELRTLVGFLWPADIEMAMAILSERCVPSSTVLPGEDS